MREYQKGDETAFNTLYQRHSPRVFGYLKKRMPRPKAEEVLQMIFLKLHQSRSQFDCTLPFSPWLFTITRSVVIDAARKGSIYDEARFSVLNESHEPAAPEEEVPVPPVPSLSGLDREKRECLEMRYLDEMTYESIAKRLRVSEDTVRQRVSRAIKSLRLGVKRQRIV